MLIRREIPADTEVVRAIHLAAFAREDGTPGTVEANLVDELRVDAGWINALSWVAVEDDNVIGHVVCTRATVGPDALPVLGLGPLGVRPDRQRSGAGKALMHAIIGAADALGEPAIVLLGHPTYYPRFGFQPAVPAGIVPPDPGWEPAFQLRTLTTYAATLRGDFVYAEPFRRL
ncbi:N-acetyltransferase [Fodinicola feengrottensis]|uniref:N-acetyltransferase n=1 Tax=Fodinicola feengrottensis TaxID=435914 RepID=A0ABN2HRI7_9ACTN